MTLRIRIFAALALAFAFAVPAVAQESEKYQNLLTPLLDTKTDIVEQPLAYPSGAPKVTAAIVTIPPGETTGWHTHEVPLFVYILEGEVSVDYGDKGTKVYKAGDSFMEAMNWPHNATNTTSEPVRIMAVYMGAEGATNTASAEGRK